MRSYIKACLAVLIGFIWSSLDAQQFNSMYFQDKLPQANDLNPAFQPRGQFYIGFPGVSKIYFGFHTNFINLEEAIVDHPDPRSEYKYTTILHPDFDGKKFESWLQGLPEKNIFGMELSCQFLSFGFKAKDMFFNFSLSYKQEQEFMVPKDLFRFMRGNSDFLGGAAKLDYLDVEAIAYNELAVGVSKPISSRLILGAKAKVLYGLANVHVKNSRFRINTLEDSIGVEVRMVAKMSGPFGVKMKDNGKNIDDFTDDFDNIEDYASSTKNPGFAIDFGGEYELDDKITLYGSVLDLGFIRWKENTTILDAEGTYYFSGVVGDSIDKSSYKWKDNELDKLKDSYTIDKSNGKYTTFLGPKIYLGGTYELTKKINIGALARTKIYNRKLRQQLTLSANTNFLPGFFWTMSYSMMHRTYLNIGTSLAFRIGPWQWYLGSDNLNNLWSLHKSQSANFIFGMNFVFGYNRDKKMTDEPLVD